MVFFIFSTKYCNTTFSKQKSEDPDQTPQYVPDLGLHGLLMSHNHRSCVQGTHHSLKRQGTEIANEWSCNLLGLSLL